MKRSLTLIFSLSFALLLVLTAGLSFASDKAAVAVRTDATVKADAEKTDGGWPGLIADVIAHDRCPVQALLGRAFASAIRAYLPARLRCETSS